MNKLAISLLIVCAFAVASAASYKPSGATEWYWVNCQEAYKGYADFTNTDDSKTKKNVLGCAEGYFTSEYREKCETKNGLSTLSAEFQKFYKDCVVAYYSDVHDLEIDNDQCGEKKDICNNCQYEDNTACKTFLKEETEAYKKFSDASTENCKLATACPAATLKTNAKATCESYETSACLYNWRAENMSDDVCVEAEQCKNFSIIAKFSAFILLAFLAF